MQYESYMGRFSELVKALGIKKPITNKLANFIRYEIEAAKITPIKACECPQQPCIHNTDWKVATDVSNMRDKQIKDAAVEDFKEKIRELIEWKLPWKSPESHKGYTFGHGWDAAWRDLGNFIEEDLQCDCCGWDDHGFTHEPSCTRLNR